MRTIRTKVYKFNELSKQAKESAINWYLLGNDDSSLAWDNIIEDSIQVGLKIYSIDDHRPNHGEFVISAKNTATRIIENHGKTCETYKTASRFLDDWKELVEKYSDGINIDEVYEDYEYEFYQEADELEDEFLKSLLEDYRIMYNNDIEYKSSYEAITETITANDYEFTADGRII